MVELTRDSSGRINGAPAWHGLVQNQRPWRSRTIVEAPLRRSNHGGAGAFLALTRNGERYWVKTLNSPQGDRIAITEQLVGRAGALIRAPVRPVATLYVPKALAGWEFRTGHRLEPGCVHGSLALHRCVEERSLRYRQRDENATRHVGYYALYDWCWGGDVQGLFHLSDDRAMHSHDHGWFLPPEGPAWSLAALWQRIDEPHELGEDGAGLDLIEVEGAAERLEAVTREQIFEVVRAIPRAWPVTDQELEAVGAFLEYRAPKVAARLRARFGGGS